MNHVNSSLAKTEIIKQLGCFPAFLFPAIKSSSVYQSLVDQTLFAYINNPLPPQFKEKLFVILSRYNSIDYFTICHSCTLRSLGLSAADVLALGELQYPRSEADVIGDLELLSCQWRKGTGWNNSLKLEVSLLRCACLLFLYPEQTANLSASLKDLLGTVYYHYLIVLLGYIKLCHQWLKSNNGIDHQQDRRSQLHLGSLLLEEIKLAQFFQTTPQSPLSETYSQPASSQSVADKAISYSAAVEVATPQPKQKTLTTCLANAPFPVMIHNRQGKIIHLNRNWLEASGYDLKEISTIEGWNQKAQIEQREIVKLTAKNSSQLYQKYVAAAHQTALEATSTLQQIVDSLIEIAPETTKAEVRAARKLTEAIRSEVMGTTKSGDRFYWELYSTALNFESETDELVISIAKDITELVHCEARLTEVEAKLRLVSEATKTGTWSWDLTTNRVDVCRQGRIILGLENFNGSYKNFLQSIHPNERESIDLEIAKAIQANRDLDIKYSVVKSDGQVGLIHAKGKLNYNSLKQPVSLEGVLADLTLSQIALADIPSSSSVADKMPAANSSLAFTNMAQSLSELKTIIDLLPCYLFVVNIKTKAISLVNARLTNSLSLSKQEVTGKTIADCFPAEYAQQIALQHQQAIDSQQVLQIQEEVTLPDGIHYFDTVVTPLYDDSGDIYALLHTCWDIPNFAATQEVISQRTSQLEAANRELESFSYSVSHDLQAPLRIINGFSQVLQENYQAILDKRGKHYLQRIQANSKRMSDLIDALLQLSRVTRSQMKPVEVNLSAIAKDIMEELRADNSQRQVSTKIAPSAKAKGDPQLLRIVLNNLLHNAWKYTSKRSLAQIEFGVVATAAKPTFFVRDNGAGFDPEYADKLFIAFQRLHSQAEFRGTGIGLATVQRIIYRHGGKVWAEGERDAGATIYFSL